MKWKDLIIKNEIENEIYKTLSYMYMRYSFW